MGGIIVGHAQLFLDHLPFLFHFLRVQQRMKHQVKQYGECLLKVQPGHLAPENRYLTVGAGIHNPAHALYGLADEAGGGPAFRSLEGQVLQEVGQPSQFVRLVAGTCPHADGDDTDVEWGIAEVRTRSWLPRTVRWNI